MEGIKISSRAKWIDNGEQNSKLFCNLENNNSVSKYMTKLIKKGGNQTTNQTEIIEELGYFIKLFIAKEII